MPKAMDLIKFKKLIKQYNLRMTLKTKHSSIITDKNGNFIMAFAITHSKDGKDYVKGNYIVELHKKLKELN